MKVALLDSTIREGEQSPNVSFSVEQKIEIVKALDDFGVEFIELGHPSTWKETVEIPGGILLSVDAPELTCEDRGLLDAGAIVIVDCTWARVETVLQRVGVESGEAIARRSLPKDVVTAYPRTSKLFDDPDRGLASIEAVFTATVALGHPSPDFLLHYRWASEFLAQNDLTWRRLGWDPQSSHHGAIGE